MNEIILSHKDVLSILPDRIADTHKGDYGKILLLCGSLGYTGAAALAAMGALRSGAGLVYLGVPASIYEIEAVKLTEPIVFKLPDKEGKYDIAALNSIRPMLKLMDAVLIGPGIGKSKDVSALVHCVLREYSGPIVLDADGINAISEHKDILRERTGVTILTPHAGEFKRLDSNLYPHAKDAAERFAEQYGVIVVYKGNRTVITDGQTTFINQTGNPGMAVGGSGDVLAGMITSFVGQGIDPVHAAACSVWLHGRAGDICAEQLGQYGMLPSDMLSVLPRLMK